MTAIFPGQDEWSAMRGHRAAQAPPCHLVEPLDDTRCGGGVCGEGEEGQDEDTFVRFSSIFRFYIDMFY